jgi:hypothetical protein
MKFSRLARYAHFTGIRSRKLVVFSPFTVNTRSDRRLSRLYSIRASSTGHTSIFIALQHANSRRMITSIKKMFSLDLYRDIRRTMGFLHLNVEIILLKLICKYMVCTRRHSELLWCDETCLLGSVRTHFRKQIPT